MKRIFTLCSAALLACHHAPAATPVPSQPPTLVLGDFHDDYEDEFTVTPTLWIHHPQSRYHIVRWNVEQQYLIAWNDSTNPSARGQWTRIDWLPLPGMAPYTWGYCYSAYNAPSADSAEATRVVKRETPKSGCNGHPFSRMKRLDHSAP